MDVHELRNFVKTSTSSYTETDRPICDWTSRHIVHFQLSLVMYSKNTYIEHKKMYRKNGLFSYSYQAPVALSIVMYNHADVRLQAKIICISHHADLMPHHHDRWHTVLGC